MGVEDAVPDALAKSRPRRHAAVTAAVKVTDGFVQEAAPIDTKRREVELDNTARKRKKGCTAPEQGMNGEEHESMSGAVSRKSAASTRNVSTKQKAGKKRKAREVVTETESTEVNLTEDTSHQNRVEQAAPIEVDSPAPATRPARKPRKKYGKEAGAHGQVSEAPHEVDEENEQSAFLQPAPDLGHPSAKSGTRAATSQRAATKTTGRAKSSRNDEPVQAKRQPLRETNMNVTMRSESPEKQDRKDSVARPVETNSKDGKRQRSPATNESSRTNPIKRRKLQIQRDDGDELKPISTTAGSTDPVQATVIKRSELQSQRGGEELDPSSTVSDPFPEINDMTRNATVCVGPTNDRILVPGTFHSAIRDGGSLSSRQVGSSAVNDAKTVAAKATKRLKGGSNTRRKVDRDEPSDRTASTVRYGDKGRNALRSESQSTVPASAVQNEDVDWLFAPQPQYKPEPAPKASKRRLIAPDMDLDDLLSNIASFAHVQPQRAEIRIGGGGVSTGIGKQAKTAKAKALK